ncbi:MAG: hypothetical protein LBE84_09530, partial [Planctomycetota bacterium]|nr:hypothetical protein [Planctomycetota bacterium]
MISEASPSKKTSAIDDVVVADAVNLLFQYLGNLLYNPESATLNVEELPEVFRELGSGLEFFAHTLIELRKFAAELGKGNLSVKPPSAENELSSPLKSLHASLRHLTWQSQQVAKGDYKQKVDFMGEFADAFNTMTYQLDERREALLNEIALSRRKTLALEQNIVLFKAITERISQWIMVLDRAGGVPLFVNNSARGMMENSPGLAEKLSNWLQERMTGAAGGDESRDTEYIEFEIEGAIWYLSVVRYPLSWLNHDAMVFMIADMSEEHKYIQELESVAYQDALTHVNSRHYGMRTLHTWV